MTAVRFPTWNPTLLKDMRRPGIRRHRIEAVGELLRPDALPPRPAVVILEGLSGISPHREVAYARKLVQWGYVVLVVDSFKTRGAERANDNVRAFSVTTSMMLADAYAALRYLSGHPMVLPDAVSVLGFSYGAMVAVLTAYEQIRRRFADGDAPRFAGHIGYYGCSIPRLEDPQTTGAPVLMMLAEHDRNVSTERSKEIADDLRRGGSDASLIVFENAYHQWDGRAIKPELIVFSLRNCRLVLDRNDEMRDERTGLALRSPLSQALFLAAYARPIGYIMRRNEDILRRSDRALHDFLEQIAHDAREPDVTVTSQAMTKSA